MKEYGEGRIARASLGLAILIACQVPLTCTSAFAQSTPSARMTARDYDIPANSLDRVLVAVAAQSRSPISFDAAMTASFRSAGVKGSFTVEQAVDKALQGTAFERFTTGSGALGIREKATHASEPAAGVEAGAAILPQITVHDSAAAATTGFTAANSSSATRTDTPISETAQSIQVITQDVMRSQQTQNVQDVLTNVSGVTITPAGYNQSAVDIRGFEATVSTDGLSGGTGSLSAGGLNIPLIGIDRIDVVKGADSILAGVTAPGGVVNVVRKRPQADPEHEVTLQMGSYGDALAGLDLAGAISEADHLNYRLVISGERTGETYGGWDGKRTLYFAPSIGYKTEDTDLVVGFEQNTQHTPVTPYTMIVNGTPALLHGPIGNASDYQITNSSTLYYDLSQKLTPNITFTSKASYAALLEGVEQTFAKELTDSGLALFLPFSTQIHQYATTLEETLQAKVATGPLSHTLLAGFSYQKTRVATDGDVNAADATVGSIYTAVFAPVNQGVQPSSLGQGFSNQFYLQDQISAFGRLHVLASISHGQAWSTNNGATEGTDGAWSPNIGVLYQVTGDLAVYANYLKSFVPQEVDLLVSGSGAPASIGKQVEVGVKGNFLDDRLTGSLALYRAAATNTVVPSAETGLDILSVGGDVSRGVELDVSGELTKGWNVIANYTYNAERPVDVYSPLSNLPRHTARLWSTYAFQTDQLHGFGFGAGISVQSSYKGTQLQTGEPLSTFVMPGQASTDMSLFYNGKDWSATFGIKNLLDHRLYGDYAQNAFVAILPGREFLLTATHKF